MGLWEDVSKEHAKIAGCIEQTNIKVESKREDIEKTCLEVLKFKFHAAVVLPYFTGLAKEILKDKARVVTVIGFPYGVQPTQAKAAEVRELFDDVDEFDMIINRPAFLNKDYDYVVEDIRSVVRAAYPKTVKVIIESPTLSEEEIRKASELVVKGGAHFVKTAVGYSGPAKVGDVKAMKSAVRDRIGIKASGGIKTFEQALEMIKAGATRIGTSSGVEIMESALA